MLGKKKRPFSLFSNAHLTTALKRQTNLLYRSLKVAFWLLLVVLNWLNCVGWGRNYFFATTGRAALCVGRKGTVARGHTRGRWLVSVQLDLVVGVWVQGACTDPGEYAELGHDFRQVI